MLLFPMIYYFCTHLDKHNDHEKQTIFYYSSHAAVSNIAILHNPALTNDPFCPFRQVLPSTPES